MTYSERLERFTERTGIKTGGIKFLHFVLIPLLILSSIEALVINRDPGVIILHCLQLGSLIVSFILLFQFDQYSYWSCMVALGLRGILTIYACIIVIGAVSPVSGMFGATSFAATIASAVTGFSVLVSIVITAFYLIIAACIWGYLHKRRELFGFKKKNVEA